MAASAWGHGGINDEVRGRGLKEVGWCMDGVASSAAVLGSSRGSSHA